MALFNTYFSARFVLNSGAILCAAFSPRSDGKTFDCKFRALEDYAKDRSQTLYVRRWKSEITPKMYNNFFLEVLKTEVGAKFLRWKFKYSRDEIKVHTPDMEKNEWDTILYFCPLSVSGKIKSQISDVLRIKMIDFDEYIPLDGRYIKGEMSLLMELWKTIDRDRDLVQIMICGNKVSPFCPLLDYFDIPIKLTGKDRISCFKSGTIAIQIYSNKEHEQKREQSKFRIMVKNTEYDEYEHGGILNALELSIKSTYGFDCLWSFKTIRGEGTIWYSNGQMIISTQQRNDKILIVDQIIGKEKREQYKFNVGGFANNFKHIYRTGRMYFDNEKAFYLFEPILKKCGMN